jgi:hypothetical protein
MEETARLVLILYALAMAALLVWSADGQEDPSLSKADDHGPSPSGKSPLSSKLLKIQNKLKQAAIIRKGR